MLSYTSERALASGRRLCGLRFCVSAAAAHLGKAFLLLAFTTSLVASQQWEDGELALDGSEQFLEPIPKVPPSATRQPEPTSSKPAGQPYGPNFLFILADDIGYGEYGLMPGRTNFNISTPNIDKFFLSGMRFTDFYANHECVPSRGSLLTGKHLGHSTLRSNQFQFGLEATDVTFLEVLESYGYINSCIGKWHVAGQSHGVDYQYAGNPEGAPWNKGCSRYYGAELFQRLYPAEQVYRYNRENGLQEFDIPANVGASREKCMGAGNTCVWMTDLNLQEALSELEYHKARQVAEAAAGLEPAPFFMYLAWVEAHSGSYADEGGPLHNLVPDNPDFAAQTSWPYYEQDHAAAISTYHDAYTQLVLEKLEELGLSDNTVVIYASDNGANDGNTRMHRGDFFQSSGPLTGYKFWLTEGGIRVAAAVRWPGGNIASGTVSHEPLAFWDMFPTILDIAGVPKAQWPSDLDGVSFYEGVLLQQPVAGSDVVVPSASFTHPPLYWEACTGQSQRPKWSVALRKGYAFTRAIRVGRWKGYQSFLEGTGSELRLYDMSSDMGETTDVSLEYHGIAQTLRELMDAPGMRSVSSGGLNFTAADGICKLWYGDRLP